MSTDQNLAAEADNMGDDLTEIEGLGDGSAEALYKFGIKRFADFAQYGTPDKLHAALLKAEITSIPLTRIKNKRGKKKKDWLQQAEALNQKGESEHGPLDADDAEAVRELGEAQNQPQDAEPEHGPPETNNAETVQDSGEVRDQPNWIPHTGFLVIFDYVMDEDGEQEWRTRIRHTRDYQDVNDGDKEFPGVDPSPWVEWILERAELPSTAGPEVTETPTLVESEVPASPEEPRIEIVDLQLCETGPSSTVPERRLMAKVHFRLSGQEAETLAADRLPFRVEIHTVDQKEHTSRLVTSEGGQLEPQRLTYESEQLFPIPEVVGRYDSHCLVLLLPPGAMAAHRQGPTIKRV